MLTWDEKIKLDDKTSELPAWIEKLMRAAGLSDIELDEILDEADLFTQVKTNVDRLKQAESVIPNRTTFFPLLSRDERAENFPGCFVAYLQSHQVFFQLPGNYSRVKSIVLQNRGLSV